MNIQTIINSVDVSSSVNSFRVDDTGITRVSSAVVQLFGKNNDMGNGNMSHLTPREWYEIFFLFSFILSFIKEKKKVNPPLSSSCSLSYGWMIQ